MSDSPFSTGGALAYPPHVRTVLLVDDSEDVREVLRLLVAADDLEALPLLRERAPGSMVVVYAAGSRSQNEPAALAAGATSYFEKGVSAKAVVVGTAELLEAASA